jgi:hypothetical protein
VILWPVARIVRTHEIAMQLKALDHLQGLHAIAAGVAPAMCGKEGMSAYTGLVKQFTEIYRG